MTSVLFPQSFKRSSLSASKLSQSLSQSLRHCLLQTLSLSQYPLPLQSTSVLDPRLCLRLPGSDPRLLSTTTLPTIWNHAFVCPAPTNVCSSTMTLSTVWNHAFVCTDLTYACLTTMNLNNLYCPCFPCYDPCLSDYATTVIKPLLYFLNLVWRLVPLSCSLTLTVQES